jgi:hypothetical protein
VVEVAALRPRLLMVWFMVFDATFNNISVISWWSVLLVGETGVPGETPRSFMKTGCSQGWIQDFKLGGDTLKKIVPSGGKREHFWGISCKKSRFYAKKSIFFQF